MQNLELQVLHQVFPPKRWSMLLHSRNQHRVAPRSQESIPAMCIMRSSGIIKRVQPLERLIPPRLNGLVPGNEVYPGRRTFALVVVFRNHSLPDSKDVQEFPYLSEQVNKCEWRCCLHVLTHNEDISFLPNFSSTTRDSECAFSLFSYVSFGMKIPEECEKSDSVFIVHEMTSLTVSQRADFTN